MKFTFLELYYSSNSCFEYKKYSSNKSTLISVFFQLSHYSNSPSVIINISAISFVDHKCYFTFPQYETFIILFQLLINRLHHNANLQDRKLFPISFRSLSNSLKSNFTGIHRFLRGTLKTLKYLEPIIFLLNQHRGCKGFTYSS